MRMISNSHPVTVPVILSSELTRPQGALMDATCSLDPADFVLVDQAAARNRVALARRRVAAARRAVRKLTLHTNISAA